MRRFPISLVMLFVLFSATACGRPSETSAAPDRTIKVFMRDDNTYEPKEIEVSVGETLVEVTNEGTLVHELIIGDKEEQLQYAEQMEHGG